MYVTESNFAILSSYLDTYCYYSIRPTREVAASEARSGAVQSWKTGRRQQELTELLVSCVLFIFISHQNSNSLGKQKTNRCATTNQQMPGAGEYEDQSPRIGRTSPSYRIQERKETCIQQDCRLSKEKPGPGRYVPFKTSLSKFGFTMSSSSRNSDQTIKLNNSSFNREQLLKYRKSPGPADYQNMISSFSKPHGPESMVSFTTQQTKRQRYEVDAQLVHTLHVPGPGKYTAKNHSMLETMRSSQRTVIGKSTREGSSIYDGMHVANPGPGDYDLPSHIGSKKTMAIIKSYSPRNA